ncbi:MAG TPA: hypothetical protein VET88_07165 [Gammaproteobacteria bacterium]|nr:hypothetical protein [Gammaproteobacteria bacterium]
MRNARKTGSIVVMLAISSHAAFAEGIDLDCETLSKQMVDRLDAAGLLVPSGTDKQRALDITMELCRGTEASAQQQHEAGKQEALENWFFEKQPEKPGNKRLKNLK